MSLGGGSAPEGSSGYIYYFGIHMGLGRGPVDEIVAARVGGKIAWDGSITESSDGYIDSPNLFGGTKKEGGIQGYFRVMMGEATQTASELLKALCAPTPTPGFRGTVTIHYDGEVSAVNPYPKPWSWRVRRALKGWDGDPFYPEKAVIELTGQVADVTTPPPTGEMGSSGGTATVPFAHGAKAHVVSAVPGYPNITGIGAITSDDDGSFINGWTANINEDGSADVLLPPKFFTKRVTINYYCDTALGGFPALPGGIQTVTCDQVASPIFVDYILPEGATGVQFLEFTVTDGGPTDGFTILGAPELQPDGVSMRINYSPMYYNRPVRARFGYFIGGAPASPFQTWDQGNINTPAIVEIASPPGTMFHSPWRVTSTYDGATNSTPAIDWVAHDYKFSFEGIDEDNPRIGRVGIMDIEAEGTTVGVNIYYTVAAEVPVQPNAQIKAMNPAHIIYECLTNRAWGRGLDRSVIDASSFHYAADQLFDEGFGLCLRWARRDSIATFVQSVLDHIGAVLFSDRSTALLKLKLIRGDYVAADLKLWDTSNGILSISDSAVNSASVVINEIIVNWHDPIYDEDRSINEQNLASLISSNGAFNTLTKSYPGLPTADLARRVALRDLKAQAEGLRKFKLTMDRRAWKITPGEVFRMQDESRQIPDMVVRVARVEDGTLTTGTITVDVVQDVFTLPSHSFTEDQPNTWVPQRLTPCIGDHKVIELPYFMLVRSMTGAELDGLDAASSYMGTIAETGQPQNVNYDIAVRDSAPTEDDVPTEENQLYCGYNP